jgi:hypothetical protein
VKKIIVLALITLSMIGCSQTEEFEYLDVIKEVAGMVDYYDHMSPNAKNLVKGENEIQGQCGDYALLFALKTGAYLIVANNNSIENGIYEVVGKANYPELIKHLEEVRPKDINGDPESCFCWNNDGKYLWHPKIGLYRITKIHNYIPKIKETHVWNLIGTTEIDVTWYDTSGRWQH